MRISGKRREEICLGHMQAENAHRFDEAIGFFPQPRYELAATGEVSCTRTSPKSSGASRCNPSLRARCTEEVARDVPSGPLSMEGLSRLAASTAVVMEAKRLVPLVPLHSGVLDGRSPAAGTTCRKAGRSISRCT
jgi:hypothetical protein